MKNVIPSRGADSIETPVTLRALDGVARLGDESPFARSLGTVAKQLQDASAVAGAVLLIATNTGQVLASDQSGAMTAMRTAPGSADVATLTPSDIGNATHEITASGAALADVLGAEGAAFFNEVAITARKPKRSVKQLVEDLNAAAELGGVKVNIIVDLPNGVVKCFKDSGTNLDTHVASVIAAAPASGLFAVADGVEATEDEAADPVLDI